MIGTLVAIVLLGADPNAKNQPSNAKELLQTFRSEFVQITPGQGSFPGVYTMGRTTGGDDSERPAHEVTLRSPFAVAKYEVTQNLWEALMASNPSRWKGSRNSVEMVSFEEAQEFCRRATREMRVLKLIDADERIRLPSEAEWEYVARAGTTSTYSFGDTPDKLGDYAWFTGNAAGNDPPVGAKSPNPWGLYDVHGYLWEWCADVAHPNYVGAPPNPSAWVKAGNAEMGVLRGGSWKDPASRLTSSYRRFAPRTLRDDAVGFRCVLDRPLPDNTAAEK